jgi:hypothetical protein
MIWPGQSYCGKCWDLRKPLNNGNRRCEEHGNNRMYTIGYAKPCTKIGLIRQIRMDCMTVLINLGKSVLP